MPNRSVIVYIDEGQRWDRIKGHVGRNWKKYAVGAIGGGALLASPTLATKAGKIAHAGVKHVSHKFAPIGKALKTVASA